MHACKSKFCLLKKPRSNGTPVVMNRPSTQILVSKYHSPLKESKLLGKINTEANKVQDEPGVSFKIIKYVNI